MLKEGSREKADVVFVVGGTKKLSWLWKHKRQGARILHRLDGIKWRHRVVKTQFKHGLLCMFQNRMMAIIRSRLADCVVYQSDFVHRWWNEKFGVVRGEAQIIRNGTDLERFRPSEPSAKVESALPVIICAEGHVELDQPTIRLLTELDQGLASKGIVSEIRIFGKTSQADQEKLSKAKGIRFMGYCSREDIPEEMRGGDVFLSLDVNAACPNAVVEALASGLPVVGFDTGALRELVTPEAGFLAPYGADPWKLEKPDASGLIEGVKQVTTDLCARKLAARELAQREYGADLLAKRYLKAIKSLTER